MTEQKDYVETFVDILMKKVKYPKGVTEVQKAMLKEVMMEKIYTMVGKVAMDLFSDKIEEKKKES